METHLREKTSDIVSKMKTKSRRTQIVAAIVVVVIILGLLAFCNAPIRQGSGKSLPVSEAFDSLASMLPKGSVVVARFPDEERSDLYYLNSGVLYCFNGKSKLLEEMPIPGVPNGAVINAKLAQDEIYMILTVRDDKLDRLFRLNTKNRNIVDLEQSTAVPEEAKEVEEKTSRPAEHKSEVPEITEPLPEAAFADEPTGEGHEVKKEEPKKNSDAPEVTTISTD